MADGETATRPRDRGCGAGLCHGGFGGHAAFAFANIHFGRPILEIQKTFPCFAPRASGQTLSHSDDLRRVPAAASRRWNIAPIERSRGRSRRQRGELVQDRPEPLGAVGRRRQHPMFAQLHPTRPPTASDFSLAVPTKTDSLSKMRINRAPGIF
jgi:hypothetical protein